MSNIRLKINFGESQFVVNTGEYSYERVVELSEKVADIRRKHSLFAKYPLEEGETREKWRERVEPLIEKDMIRKDGEPVEAHLRRLYEAKVDTHEMAFDIINAVAEVFRLKPVDRNDFKAANWLAVKSFIYDVLNLGDIPCDDFYPKRTVA